MNASLFRRNAGYAGLSGAYWMLYCVALSYSSVFLLARGFTNGQIGGIVAAGHILGLALQPAAAAAADRTPRAPVAVMLTCGAAAGLLLASLLLLPGRSLGVTAAFVSLVALTMALQPLVNAYSFTLELTGVPIRFGVCRGIGSLSYAVLSALLGMAVVRAGARMVPTAGLAVVALLLLLLLGYRRLEVPARPPAAEEPKKLTLGEYAARYRSFLFLLAGTAFVFFGHSIALNFTMQIVANVGGDSGDMGLLCSYIALLELPAMFLFDRLRRRFSCTDLLKFSAVFFVVKNLLVLYARSVAGLYAGFFFQALSFPLFIPASVRYAGDRLPPESRNRAQALITAMITVGNICASGLGGVMIDRRGMGFCLAVSAGIAAAGAALILLGMQRERRELYIM